MFFCLGCSSHGRKSRRPKKEQASKNSNFNRRGGDQRFCNMCATDEAFLQMQLCVLAGSRLETSLDQSEQRVCELSQALAQSEEQLSQQQSLSQSQNMEIKQLRNVCTQLGGVQEMNEVGVCCIFCSPLLGAFALSRLDWNTVSLWKLNCSV